MDPVTEAFIEGWQPYSRMGICEWARQNVNLHSSYVIQGPFHVERARYLQAPLEALADPEIREVTVSKAVQTGGSLAAEVFVSWLIDNAPGPCMWNMQTDEDAQEAAEQRINPLFELCPPVMKRMPSGRYDRRKTRITFFNCWLLIQGAGLANLQSKSVQYLVNDECWLWRPGNLSEAWKRTSAFTGIEKTLNISQGGVKGDEFDQAFEQGCRAIWGFKCPSCGEVQPWLMDQLRWDENEQTRPGGEWRIGEVAKTIRYECLKCHRRFLDSPAERRVMNDAGEYIITNPNALPSRRSYRWNALACDRIPWVKLAEEKLHAVEMTKNGSVLELQAFVQKRLAEAWEERQQAEEAKIILSDRRMGEGIGGDEQGFLTVDVQKDCFYAVVRTWRPGGASRLVWCGRMTAWEDIETERNRWGLNSRRVLIDSRFRTMEVYERCVRYGWAALRGEDRNAFVVERKGRTFHRIWNADHRGDPGMGTSAQGRRTCPLILWAHNPVVNDMLDRFRRGLGPLWELPGDVPEDYLKQMDSMAKRKRHHKITGAEIWEWVRVGDRPNHYWDCECEQIVAASMARGVLRVADLGHRPPPDDSDQPDAPSSRTA